MMTTFKPEDIFLVTGASSGIGEGTALLLNEHGATVIASGRNESRLAAIRESAAHPSQFHCEIKDLAADIDGLTEWVFSLKNKFGKLRGLVHCAGVTETAPLGLAKYSSARELFDIDYFAPLFLAKGMADRRVTVGPGASMTFIASLAGVRPAKGQGIYGGAKAALINSMTALAKELAPRRVRVNCVSPALIMTPMGREFLKEFVASGSQEECYPLGTGEVSDVASLAVFLAGDQARWITGQNYVLDGGLI